MNHVWKKKQDIKKHGTQDPIACVQLENKTSFLGSSYCRQQEFVTRDPATGG